MSVAVLLGLVASSLSIYAPVPQILRAVRTRSAEGVSWNSLVLSLMTFTWWIVYGIAVADSIQIINNVLAMVLLCVLALAVFRAGVRGSCWAPVLGVLATAGASILLLDQTNSFTLAMVGTVISSSRLFPQTRLAVSGAPLWGLCPWSTLVGWLSMVAWVSYGVTVGDVGVTVCSGIAALLQTAILVHRLPPRRTLHSLASGRLGDSVALMTAPASARFPYRDRYKLAA